MSKKESDLNILLLQIRDDEESMQEELAEFARYSGLSQAQFTVLDAFRSDDFSTHLLDPFDALFVGGSSDASVLFPEEYHFVHGCKKLLRYAYEQNIPTFASCFGFQVVVEEFGGKVVLDKENMEMGIYQIFLTEDGHNDILFADIPDGFWAISGHKERAFILPEGTDMLAYSELCPYHAFKFPDKPFYAFQFHPEVDRQDLVTRITRYKERYLEDEAALTHIIESAVHETTYSNQLVRHFIERILLPHLTA